MRLFAFAAAALSLMVAGAAANPVEQRQENMKERRNMLRILGPIAQGKADFDAGVVTEALQKLDATAKAAADVEALWPQGSDSGDTEAFAFASSF